jgi:hypothetical protein
MLAIEKMRMGAITVIKSALEIIIAIIVLLLRHLNKRVAIIGIKRCRVYLIAQLYKFFFSGL